MHKKLSLIIFCALFFSTFSPSVSADVICTGEPCSEALNIQFNIKEILIEAKLNLDESIDFTETAGMSFNLTGNETGVGVIVPEIYLPYTSTIYPEIQVTDINEGHDLRRVYSLEENCTDEFVFNEDENAIELCLLPQAQARIRIQAKIFSRKNISSYEEFIAQSDYLSNPIVVSFPGDAIGYPMSMKIEGGDGVTINNVSADTCADPAGNRSGIRFIPAANGLICVGTIEPGTHTHQKILSVQAFNQRKQEEKQREQLSILELENINASIKSSQAAVRATDLTSVQIYLTVTIAILTGLNIYLVFVNTKESRRINKPRLKTRIDTLPGDKFALKIVNAGKSAATDADFEYTIEPGGGTHCWNHHLIEENEAIHFIPKQFKDTTVTEFLSKYDTIKIKSRWKGSGGRIYKEQYEIKLKDYKKSLETNLQLSEKEY